VTRRVDSPHGYYRPVTSVRDADEGGDTLTEPAWHERTSTVVGPIVAVGRVHAPRHRSWGMTSLAKNAR